ncbi:hypothetical protein N431DRAFT_470085 [Stipitochalara longipes BDJ]|nr:hypothetical protein N431DRAFT_470085 [Stipitochalara longipes BDJ]
MSLFTLLGLLIAIAHNFYFQHLDGQLALDNGLSSQQIVKQAGNAFVFLTLACFRAAIMIAYNQYIWTIFRRKALKVSSVDKVFSLPSKLLSFCSLQLLKEAPFALILGAVPWLLFLGGLTPTATLSVMPALYQQPLPGQVPTLDFTMPAWAAQSQTQYDTPYIEPRAEMLKIAYRAAMDMKIEPPLAPSLNSSYSIQFYGPTVQCSDPTPLQQTGIEYYMNRFAQEKFMWTVQQRENKSYMEAEATFGSLVLSAFSGTVFQVNEFQSSVSSVDSYNNWYPEANITFNGRKGGQEIWFQLSNQTMVCTAVNASFDVGFEFSDGVGSVSYQNIQILPAQHGSTTTWAGEANAPNATELDDSTVPSNSADVAYFASFLALGSNIFGNVTLMNDQAYCYSLNIDGGTTPCPSSNATWTLEAMTTRISLTGLIACVKTPLNASNFPSEPWMCRNRTLARGIEDLANNLTISMLSSASFTTNTTTQIIHSLTQNVYKYDKKNLLISYGAVIIVTVVAVLIGIVSLIKNGVNHDGSFSAIMATTRNPDLDEISQGACLGSTKDIAAKKVMFGVLTQISSPKVKRGEGYSSGYGEVVKHTAFGLEGSVVRLKKGSPCS